MYLIKDKLRHIKYFNSLFEQNLLASGSAKLEVVRNTPLTGAGGRDFYREKVEAKQGIY